MRLLIGAIMGLVVAIAATASASALAETADRRSCNLCLEQAARQSFCESKNPDQLFDFDCLCAVPQWQNITRGCADFCSGSQYALSSQCVTVPVSALVKGDARSCKLCLEQAARQSHCESNDPNKLFDFDCLCHAPGSMDLTKGCADFCGDTKYRVDSQCLNIVEPAEKDVALAARGPYDCAICLQEAEIKSGCVNDPSDPNYNFECLCQETNYSANVKNCNLFCAGTSLGLDNQCKLQAPALRRDTHIVARGLRECTLCLEVASAQTNCGDPFTPGFNFHCLCQDDHFNKVTGCSSFCANTPNDLHSQCNTTITTSSPTQTPTLPPRRVPTQTTRPRFGFCGPKGVNCKSTEHAPSLIAGRYAHKVTHAKATLTTETNLASAETLQVASGGFGFCGVSGGSCKSGPEEETEEGENEVKKRRDVDTITHIVITKTTDNLATANTTTTTTTVSSTTTEKVIVTINMSGTDTGTTPPPTPTNTLHNTSPLLLHKVNITTTVQSLPAPSPGPTGIFINNVSNTTLLPTLPSAGHRSVVQTTFSADFSLTTLPAPMSSTSGQGSLGLGYGRVAGQGGVLGFGLGLVTGTAGLAAAAAVVAVGMLG